MRCTYTFIEIPRRFGVPQAYEAGKPLQLIGEFGSIGILIRHLCSRIKPEGGVEDHILSALSRVGAMIGRPFQIKRTEKGDIEYSKEELKALTDLAAPDSAHLEINGGKLTVAEYLKRDKTWNNPEFERFGQTHEEVVEQKKRMNEKRAAKRARTVGKKEEDHRVFYFGLSGVDDKNSSNISRVTIEDLVVSGFLNKPKDVRVKKEENGLKICISGGSSHNKLATKKFYGKNHYEKHPIPIKGEAFIICTNQAPLEVEEYMEPEEQWLTNYIREKGGAQMSADPLVALETGLSKKVKTKSA